MSTVIETEVGSQKGIAALWFKNGDHPHDGPVDQEGKVVRYFRDPKIDGESVCETCGRKMHDHGFIEEGTRIVTSEERSNLSCTVCPSDWVMQLTGSSVSIVCNQSEFVNTIYHAEAMNNKTYASNFLMRKTLREAFKEIVAKGLLFHDNVKALDNELLKNPFTRHTLTVFIIDDYVNANLSVLKNNYESLDGGYDVKKVFTAHNNL